MIKYFLPLLLLVSSCYSKKEKTMTSFHFTEKEICACFNDSMNYNTFFSIDYYIILKDGTVLKPYGTGNSYLTSVHPANFKNSSDSCYCHPKTDWDNPLVEKGIVDEVEKQNFCKSLKTEDVKEIKYVVYKGVMDTLNVGVFYPNKK